MQPSTLVVPPAPRFGWPMRVFLCVVLFHMLFRSTTTLYPWSDWASELEIERMPRRLPTRAELAKSEDKALSEFGACAGSLPRYWCPWPNKETHAHLKSAEDWGCYSLAWTTTRMQWCECVLSVHQTWPMFTSTSKRKYPTRARLFYADGSEITVRQRSEVDDLTCFSRWSQGKNLGFDPNVSADSDLRYAACPGYCNYLLHRFATNDAGSPLREIQLYQIAYNFPPPHVDAHAFLTDLMEKTRDHDSPLAWPTFYRFWPERRKGEFVK